MVRLGFLTGVILGTAVASTFVLAIVLVVLLAASGDPRPLLLEHAGLVRATASFGALAAVAAAALAAQQGRRRWRWIAQGAMWLMLLAMGSSYWWPGWP